MLTKIRFDLSVGSINTLINKINLIDNIVKDSVEKASLETAEFVAERVIKPATPIDTGESRNSTKVTKRSNGLSITQTGTHVFENEFGTGPRGASTPHPSPPPGWQYQPTYWYFTPTNPSSKYYLLGKNNQPVSWRTYGQVASAQMYQGSQAFKANIKEMILIKVGDGLSKI